MPTLAPKPRPTQCGRRGLVLAIAIWVLALSAGCGSNSGTRMPLLFRSPLEASQLRVERALESAREVAANQPTIRAQLRYNPATCACPPWEARIFGHWQRVDLQPPPTREHRGMQHADLTPTGAHTEGASGWRYASFSWALRANDAPTEAPSPAR